MLKSFSFFNGFLPKIKKLAYPLLLSIGISSFLSFDQAKNTKMTLKIENILEVKGSIFVGVFQSEDGFPENEKAMFYNKIVPVSGKTVEVIIPYAPSGEVAVVVFQDLNNNKDFDKNFIGMPLEPFGFSNNVEPLYKAPSFEECKVTNSKSVISISLLHRY